MSLMLTKEDLAKYPFLKQSAAFIESRELDLNDLASEEYSGVLSKALSRVKNALQKNVVPVDLKDPEAEILAYPLALAFVYGSKSGWIINRFATMEAKRVEEELRREPREKLIEIADSGFGWKADQARVKLEWEEFAFSLPFQNYLEAAPSFNSAQWKLVNRQVSGGRVFLNHGALARLLSEAFKIRITKRATEKDVMEFRLPEVFRPHLEELLSSAKDESRHEEELPQGLVTEARPPCILAIMEDVKAGKSLSHMARFALTTFLVNVGESVDDVLKVFGNVADFDEGKARYQIEHIAGMIGSRTKYKPPKCDVLRSFGLCVGMDDLCRVVKHPLSYYKKKLEYMKAPRGKGVARDRKERV